MNNLIRLLSPCKVNLSLDITGMREDGYHLVETLMHTVSLCDTVLMELGGAGIRVDCSMPGIPAGEGNLAHRAARAFFDAIGQPGGAVRIYIEKHIPFQAGLGGGSSNAAAVLRGLERLTGISPREEALHAIATRLGADVPFFLKGGCALAQGIGERLTPQPLLPDCHLVLAKPSQGISTKNAFMLHDKHGARRRPDTRGILTALSKGDIRGVAEKMQNVLYEVSPLAQVDALLELLQKHEALGSLMSGSGSCVFGIFTDGEKAAACHKELLKYAPFAVMAQPCPHSPIFLPPQELHPAE